MVWINQIQKRFPRVCVLYFHEQNLTDDSAYYLTRFYSTKSDKNSQFKFARKLEWRPICRLETALDIPWCRDVWEISRGSQLCLHDAERQTAVPSLSENSQFKFARKSNWRPICRLEKRTSTNGGPNRVPPPQWGGSLQPSIYHDAVMFASLSDGCTPDFIAESLQIFNENLQNHCRFSCLNGGYMTRIFQHFLHW